MTVGVALLVLSALLTILEIHSFTIYFLAVALACLSGALTAFYFGGLTAVTITVGVALLVCLPAAHWLRKRMQNKASDEVTCDDVGRRVEVISKQPNAVKVSYRGSVWDAKVETGEAVAVGQAMRIKARDGSTLLVETEK